MRISTRIFLVILLLSVLSRVSVHAEVTYTLTDLGSKLPDNVHCTCFNSITDGYDTAHDADFEYYGFYLQFDNQGQNSVVPKVGAFGGINKSTIGAYSINRRRQVVGSMSLDPTLPHKFVFDMGHMRDVAIRSDQDSRSVEERRLYTFAFLYYNGVMQDLNTQIVPHSGWTLRRGVAINQFGQIVAEDTTPGKKSRYCLLTPNVQTAFAPASPVLQVRPRSETKIALTWMPTFGATSYSVYRGTTSGGARFCVGTVSNVTTFLDSKLQPSKTYYYHVIAANNYGISANSNVAMTSTTLPCPIENLHASGFDDHRIVLTWDQASNADTYQIYRSSTHGGSYRYIGETVAPNYIDSQLSTHYGVTLTPSTSYYYCVAASNDIGQRAKSPEAEAKTLPTIALEAISFSPSSISGVGHLTGTLTLTGVAPPANAVVELKSSNLDAFFVPPTAQLSSGLSSRPFTAVSKPVSASTPVTVTATYGGVSKTTVVTVTP